MNNFTNSITFIEKTKLGWRVAKPEIINHKTEQVYYFGGKVLTDNFRHIYSDETRTKIYLQLKSQYPPFKFRNFSHEPEKYSILDEAEQEIGYLFHKPKIIGSYWKLFDANQQLIGQLRHQFNLQFVICHIGHIFWILDYLVYLLISPLLYKLFEQTYFIQSKSEKIAFFSKNLRNNKNTLDISVRSDTKIDDRLIMACGMLAFGDIPFGNVFNPANTNGGGGD